MLMRVTWEKKCRAVNKRGSTATDCPPTAPHPANMRALKVSFALFWNLENYFFKH